jgi:adenylate cyclase
MDKEYAKRFRFGLRPTLVISIVALVLLSVGALAAMSYLSSRTIVGELGSRLIVRYLDSLERSLRYELDAVVNQADFISRAITSGKYSFDKPDALAAFAIGTMAAAPQIGGFILANEKLNAIRVSRLIDDAFWINLDSSDPLLNKLALEAEAQPGPFWDEPLYLRDRSISVLDFVVPIRYEKKHLGFVAIGIRTSTLSKFADTLSEPPLLTAFILYGRDRVLAHPDLVDGSAKLTPDNPLLALHEVEDPILAHLASAQPLREAGIRLPEGSESRVLTRNGKRYRIYMRTLDDYGDEPLVIGVHMTVSVFDRVIETLNKQALISVALVIGGAILAILLSRAISLPIRRAARGAMAVQSLDFDNIPTLEKSWIREVDNLATSFNAAMDGLKSFGRYVPRRLVARLVKEGLAGAGSEERVMSVMFTDIAGFSAMCETMSAAEVAAFINQHLTLVSQCIERESGTIDKYIGDAVMAFWGAPDMIDNTAVPACRAALAIQSAITDDNRKRVKEGLSPVRVRIGIHTGPLVVGDIGAPQRINYTVVGDVVNGGQRLEALGKEVDADAEVITLISRDTADLLPEEFELAPEGAMKVKGKEKKLEVFRLISFSFKSSI